MKTLKPGVVILYAVSPGNGLVQFSK